MSLVPPANGHRKTPFELCPPGPQQLVCCDLVDHGLVDTHYAGVAKQVHKVSIRWQSVHTMRGTGKPYLVQKRYTFSLHPKAVLRKDVDAWRGRPLTDAQAADFDLERLLGINCFASVVHLQKPRGTFAEVTTIMPLPKGMPKITVTGYVRVCDRVAGDTHDDHPPAAVQDGEGTGPLDGENGFAPPAETQVEF